MSNQITNQGGVPTLTVTEPNNLSEYRLIDVRGADEYTGELGHIQGAELVTLGPDLEQFLTKTDKNEKILFICRSGARSARATMAAMQMGYKHVFNMEGGMMGWNAHGYEVVM